jgi:putative transposase
MIQKLAKPHYFIVMQILLSHNGSKTLAFRRYFEEERGIRYTEGMEDYRTGSHSRFDIKYHFVWITKYRKGVLTGAVGHRLRELIIEICRTHEIEIVSGCVSKDHVHVLLSCPPDLSPSKILQYLKGKTSRKLMMEFQHIQKAFWGRYLWARGYFVATSGNVTNDVIIEYIRLQETGEPLDGGTNFRVLEGP